MSAALNLERLGRYRLATLIARGGMASVHLARLEGARGIDRWVAMKVIHPHLADDRRFTEMFLDEARVVSRITHPNVCAMLEYGEEEGVPFLVMEYLHGESMSSVLKAAAARGAMGGALAARIVSSAARGLHAAHDLRGPDSECLEVVHRDVSPQNIHVGYDGSVKVMDFGIASSRGRLSTTTTGEVKGKFAYMSPEQLRSEPIDRRTDVWALGVVLWEALTGQRLFRGDSEGATAINVLTRPIDAPSSVRPGVPAALDAIVARALRRDLDRRYASAAEMAEALESFLHALGEPFGTPQVAEWMAGEFEVERREREDLLESTTGRGRARAEPAVQPVTELPDQAPTRVVRPPRSASRARLVAGALLVAGAALGIATTWGDSEPTSAPTASEEVSPVPEPDRVRSIVEGEGASEDEDEDEGEGVNEGDGAGDGADESEGTDEVRPASGRTHMTMATPTGTGTLNLLAIPASEVFLGSRRLGRTPLVSVSLPAGRHRLRVRSLTGDLERRVTVSIRSGENARQTVVLAE